ncbi:M23 family metallopeptidase [Scleromatobacter humisilvae]|uniref:M23 family metallopeptidase n=1 Tax=Scleromatobacter humisilvae TaxID=2897159 RepID=A0A9X1YNL3_9BURK|nr:M23 family metallopeptidase [Scleromatobacter humisilvae]MCK9684861.1 M23 family metallopeptidase [Scleromatobacter humisilvae]
MQIMITHGGMSRTRVLHVSPVSVVLSVMALVIATLALSGAIYHYFFLKAAREGWPVVSQLVKLVVHDESAQRDKVMRENLDAMAQKVGDMQARMIKIEAMGDRVSGMAGLKPEDLSGVTRPKGGSGGPFVPMTNPGYNELNGALDALAEAAGEQSDVLTLTESRLLESRLKTLMIPSSRPIDVAVGSGFGFRADPFTGRGALHTGLDFPSPVGTEIHAAAGGVVRTAEMHPEYGLMLEIDHGNGLMTRYGHTSKILVKPGDLVKRGQVVADVGTTGRSTGPHLHFEVLVDGIPQDPQRFLAGPNAKPTVQTAAGNSTPLGAEHR